MSRLDRDVSLEEAYINRFRDRTEATRKVIILLDLECAKAISNWQNYDAFLEKYLEIAKSPLNVRDALFYALYFERINRTNIAKLWYCALDSMGDSLPLRNFYVRSGMTTPLIDRFKNPNHDELKRVILGNFNRLSNQPKYNTFLLEETIRACLHIKKKSYLEVFLKRCIDDAQIQASLRITQILHRSMSVEESYALGISLIKNKLQSKETYTYVKHVPSLHLADPYISELIEISEGRADMIFARAEDLGYTITDTQLNRLYFYIEIELDSNPDDIHPNVWLPVIEELHHRHPADWSEKLIAAYDIAVQQSLRWLRTAEAGYYADKQGVGLRPVELFIQYYFLHEPSNRNGRVSTRPFVETLLLERIAEALKKSPSTS